MSCRRRRRYYFTKTRMEQYVLRTRTFNSITRFFFYIRRKQYKIQSVRGPGARDSIIFYKVFWSSRFRRVATQFDGNNYNMQKCELLSTLARYRVYGVQKIVVRHWAETPGSCGGGWGTRQ